MTNAPVRAAPCCRRSHEEPGGSAGPGLAAAPGGESRLDLCSLYASQDRGAFNLLSTARDWFYWEDVGLGTSGSSLIRFYVNASNNNDTNVGLKLWSEMVRIFLEEHVKHTQILFLRF